MPNLVSFTFEGYNEQTKAWYVLDKRENIFNANNLGSFLLFDCSTTKNSNSDFLIRQTEPGTNNMWGFAISALEIHGIPSYDPNDDDLFHSLDMKFDDVLGNFRIDASDSIF